MRIAYFVVMSWLCFVPACATAEDVWMAVTFDGQKVGKMHVTRDVVDGDVVTSQALDIHLKRLKTPTSVHADQGATESTDGTPLGFSSAGGQSSAGAEMQAIRREDGVFQLNNAIRGESKVSLLQWPEGALLAEGQRLATVSHGFQAGMSYRLRVFEPSRQQVADLDVTVVGDEPVDLPGGTERLHHLRQVLVGGESAQSSDTWVDDAGIVRRSISPLVGFSLEMTACDEACANAPNQDVDILRAAMVASPRPLPASLRTAPLRYLVTVRGQHANPFLARTSKRSRILATGTTRSTRVTGNPIPRKTGRRGTTS